MELRRCAQAKPEEKEAVEQIKQKMRRYEEEPQQYQDKKKQLSMGMQSEIRPNVLLLRPWDTNKHDNEHIDEFFMAFTHENFGKLRNTLWHRAKVATLAMLCLLSKSLINK